MSDDDDAAGCAVVIAIGLYIAFIGWMFQTVVPPFLYISTAVASLAVPWVVLRALWATYGRGRSEAGDDVAAAGEAGPDEATAAGATISPLAILAMVFAAPLVLSAHLDLLYLAFEFMGEAADRTFLDHRSREVIARALGALSLGLSGGLVEWVVEATGGASLYVGVLGVVALKIAPLPPLVLMARGLRSKVEHDEEPARIAYFHRQAWTDVGDFTTRSAKEFFELVVGAGAGIVALSSGAHMIFTWPVNLTAFAALVPPTVVGIVAWGLVIGLFCVAMAVVWLIAMWIALFLETFETAIIRVRAGYAKCPHATCHAAVPLAHYVCPRCGARHDRLTPGKTGVLSRECLCGERLPTLFWFGKSKLFCQCPYCGKPLREELFAANVHIPIYGGPSSGKTMYMMASTWSMMEKQVDEVETNFIEEVTGRAYETRWRNDFEAGRVREKTASSYPDAFLLSVRRSAGLSTSLYLYDPAGESMEREGDLEAHRYIEHAEGIVFLIDPMSLESFRTKYQDKLDDRLRATTSRSAPEEQLQRLVNELAKNEVLDLDETCDLRLAIIFGKADLPWVCEELGIPGRDAGALEEDWTQAGLSDSTQIRSWMADNEPRLLDLIDKRFSKARFFGVSALGGEPAPDKAFEPQNVMEPFAWILSSRFTYSHPTTGRLLAKGLELAAAAAVTFAFVGIPLLLANWTL